MKTTFNREEPVKNLADAFYKAESSNNRKILEIEKSASDELRAGISAVLDSLDINKATGKTLDMYGEMIGQNRGVATDEQYRFMLRSRIVRNLTNGDHNSIVAALSMIFQCEPTDFRIVEGEKPLDVQFVGLPLTAINKAGLTVDSAMQIIKEIVPVGAQVSSFMFPGTFRFGTTAMEYDEAAGFANLEQTIGGYFGWASGDTGPDLPI